MRTRLCWTLTLAVGLLVAAGCPRTEQRPAEVPPPNDTAPMDHPITGKVISVAPDKSSVTIDHEDIPGVMPAMEMRFTVQEPRLLEGVEPGSHVQGRLRVEDGNYIITQLEEH